MEIEKIIDEKVRPAVARDGGDIIFESFDKGIVYLTLKGACVGCPSSTATLKQGIENLLTHYFSEVKEVKSL
jgi:Fe-S cluster biogenesis protein NfuA